jgi:hypothetical protein
MADTVQFNVGGRHFEVSRALIDAIPDSMLARMISETWEKEPGKPMFIDRDGDKFAHVLDYLRYGSIELPVTITQAMFQRELDYYGIPAADGSVTQVKKKTPGQTAFEIRQQHLNHKIYSLAVECNNRFANLSSAWIPARTASVQFYLTKEDGELHNRFAFWDDGWEKQLNEYLDLFGLHASVQYSNKGNGNLFAVSVKTD